MTNLGAFAPIVRILTPNGRRKIAVGGTLKYSNLGAF